MFWCLVVGFVGSLLAGGVIFATAKSAVHEIEALIFLLIAALCFCAMAVLDGMQKVLESFDREDTP